jgi:hypothetical protein
MSLALPHPTQDAILYIYLAIGWQMKYYSRSVTRRYPAVLHKIALFYSRSHAEEFLLSAMYEFIIDYADAHHFTDQDLERLSCQDILTCEVDEEGAAAKERWVINPENATFARCNKLIEQMRQHDGEYDPNGFNNERFSVIRVACVRRKDAEAISSLGECYLILAFPSDIDKRAPVAKDNTWSQCDGTLYQQPSSEALLKQERRETRIVCRAFKREEDARTAMLDALKRAALSITIDLNTGRDEALIDQRSLHSVLDAAGHFSLNVDGSNLHEAMRNAWVHGGYGSYCDWMLFRMWILSNPKDERANCDTLVNLFNPDAVKQAAASATSSSHSTTDTSEPTSSSSSSLSTSKKRPRPEQDSTSPANAATVEATTNHKDDTEESSAKKQCIEK